MPDAAFDLDALDEMYRRYPTDGLAAITDALGEKIELYSSGLAESVDSVPWAGHWTGPDGFAAFGAKVAESLELVAFDVLERMVDEDCVMYLCRVRFTVRATGAEAEVLKTDHFCRRDDGTVVYREIYHTQSVAHLI